MRLTGRWATLFHMSGFLVDDAVGLWEAVQRARAAAGAEVAALHGRVVVAETALAGARADCRAYLRRVKEERTWALLGFRSFAAYLESCWPQVSRQTIYGWLKG